MKLAKMIEVYVDARRSLGSRFVADARILKRFLRVVGDVSPDTITAAVCQQFYLGAEPRTASCTKRYSTLRSFFRFATSRRLLAAAPLPPRAPRIVSTFRPHIYSTDELRRLLDATAVLADARSPLQSATFRTILLLLYAAGLRAGEALRLSLSDVDLDGGMLRIRDSKFSKSREIPISESLCAALARYRAQRRLLPMPDGPSATFFATRTGRGVSLDRLERVFRRVRRGAQLVLPHAARRAQPRLHDLRHSFAVHRLLAWYNEGADVQQRLPWLSRYLGHRNLRGTQVYLSLTPSLLQAASTRFADYAGPREERAHE